VQLIQHVAERPSVNRLRDLTMTLTLWQTALRVSELAASVGSTLTWVGARSVASLSRVATWLTSN
jgi:hypothetical protein